jgi:hypothetical protein
MEDGNSRGNAPVESGIASVTRARGAEAAEEDGRGTAVTAAAELATTTSENKTARTTVDQRIGGTQTRALMRSTRPWAGQPFRPP